MKGFVKESVIPGAPIFQKVSETALGGFRLDIANLTAGETIQAGAPIAFDEATRVAKLVKLAKLQAAAGNTATAYQVEKGHNLKVGDHIGRTVGGAAYTISAINTTNAAYDTVTVGTTLGVVLNAGDVLFVSSAAGAAAAAYPDSARGLLYQEAKAEAGEDIAVVIDGSVYERRIPGGITSAVKSLTPKIFYSQSF